ncbi:ABC transporter permease [uncultured Arcticibacterium sp.]|uniref:ABC transporter permease n=1 Tax=uncultured Arcticibacterium sp. TaxID=2173042 RepID=UPI0030FAF872
MIKNYFKIAWRTLQKNKVYGFINVTGLMLSLTAAILIFTFIKFHLSFDNFHEDSDKIHRIVTKQKRESISYQASVPPGLSEVVRTDYDFEDAIARTVNFSDVQVTYNDNKKVLEENGVLYTESDFFEIFDFPFIEGSLTKEFLEPNKAFLTKRMAEKYFGNASSAIGQSLTLDNTDLVTIIGVLEDLPQNSFEEVEIFVSYPTLIKDNIWLVSAETWGGITSDLQCYIKLKDGVNPEQVEKAMAPFPAKYRPNSSNTHTYYLQPLSDIHFNPNYHGAMPVKTLWTLAIIGVFLLISACLNFINLATAQVLNRLKEVGVRKSLGGKKAQLFWQFLTETSLIALVSVVLAVGLAILCLPYLNHLFETEIGVSEMLSTKMFLFALTMFIISAFASGAYPGLLLARFSPVMALKGKLSSLNFGGVNLRKTLIVTQFVISQVLIIGMLVIIKQMNFSQNTDLGFDKEAQLMIPVAAGSDAADKRAFKERLQRLTNVDNASICFTAPASNMSWGTSVQMNQKDEQEAFRVSVRAGDESYLETFGLELVAGRNIRKSDTLNELMVNETFIKKMNYASAEEALNQYASLADSDNIPIVGVFKDFHVGSTYDEISAVAIGSVSDVLRQYAVKINSQNISGSMKEIEGLWNEAQPETVFSYEFVDETIKEFYVSEQRLLTLLEIFTGISIFISSLGLFGLVSFMVERKTKEIGVRKVLGSSISSILWLFSKEFSWLIGIAFLLSVPLAWWLTNQWLSDFVFQAEFGIGLFLSALLFSILISGVSVSYKVIKAAVANPVDSLKSE